MSKKLNTEAFLEEQKSQTGASFFEPLNHSIDYKDNQNKDLLANKQNSKETNLTTSKEVSKFDSIEVNQHDTKLEKKPTIKQSNMKASKFQKKFASYLPKKLIKELKLYAIHNDLEIYEVLERAVGEYIKK